MPTLIINDKVKKEIPGLGKIVKFSSLSAKRITKAVRNILREDYNYDSVEVSCSAVFRNGVWTGFCSINGHKFSYEIQP
jgi:hypothetical protein